MRSKETVADYLGLPGGSQALTRAQPSEQRQSSLGGAHVMKGPGFPDQDNHDAFPYQFQDFYLVSAGTVDRRSTYHSNDRIWPVGYRSAWHDRVTGSLFVCDVADGGDSGPVFRVHRYSCSTKSLPTSSTLLSRKRTVSLNGVDQPWKDDSTTFQVVDDDSLSTITLLNVDSPPSQDSFLPARKVEEEIQNQNISSTSESQAQRQREGNEKDGPARLSDIIGDFQVEARSTIAAWEMVSQAILFAFHEAYKQRGTIKLFCSHDAYDVASSDISEFLSRFCHFGCIGIIPPFVQNKSEFSMTYDMLLTWLNRDRFGMDSDFVQEIIEQLPGVEVCSLYSKLTERKDSSGLQTVGTGYLQAERIMDRSLRISKPGEIEDTVRHEPCPLGKQLSLRLPSYLIGDTLQIWEDASRLSEVLGLGQPFSFQELESELLGPWFDGSSLGVGCGNCNVGDADLGSCHGHLLTKLCGSLLQLLVRELLSKASAYVCPDVGESKSRRGRKKDLNFLAALKKTKLDVLPVNGLTWQEIARRYILAVLCMEGLLDSGEIVSRESGKVFHCLRGDGGILCGSFTGVAALEGDGVILADAMKDIFGSLKNSNEIITLSEREVDMDGSSVQGNADGIPKWAQVLEPVRKLPTNVGARIRKRVNEALEKNPPEWAKTILEHSISKEVYKGNASGPTKRAVISVLDKVSSENPGANTEKKEKLKITTNLADLITKQCRVVLRSAAAADDDRVFCNLLGKISLNPKANYDEGLLGYPAMVSRPLDFRTIDLKLAAGAYCGSHEAFVDDVREVWRNVRTAYGDRADLIELAGNLSQKFEDLYEKEVVSLVHKFSEMKNNDDSSLDAGKERDDFLASISKSSLPRAPWEEGLCKVCGMDRDDDNVLLCDKCDSEYHKYCLNPPLVKIPEGNWYCPSCVVDGGSTSRSWRYGSVANQIRTKGHQGGFMRTFLEQLARLANLLEIKEYWEFSLEERVFFLKYLFDEAVTTATVRKHMHASLSRVAELQQKLRFLANELKLLKSKEEFMRLSLEKANSGVHNGRGDLRSGTSSPLHITENSSRDPGQGVYTFTDAQVSGDEFPIASQQQANDEGKTSEQRDLQVLPVSTSQLLTGNNRATDHAPASLINEPNCQNFPNQSDVLSPQELRLKVRNDISNVQSSIASTESELHRVSVRKELLGQDSNGRAYWVFCIHGARPWIIANGTISPKQRCPEEFSTIPGSDQWMLYQSVSEIEKLLGWLNENNFKEKELRDSILQLQLKKTKNSEYNGCHILSKDRSDHSSLSREKAVSAGLLVTKAITALEAKLGPGEVRRCECLELLLPSNEHCFLCHNSFPTKEELIQHSKDNCKVAAPVSCRSQATERISKATEDTSKRKRLKIIPPQEKPSGNAGTLEKSLSERQNAGSRAGKSSCEPECPLKFEEIMTRFVVSNPVQDAVNEVGFIGQNGLAREGRNVDRVKSSSSTKDKSSLIGLSKSSIVRKSSLRPLVDRACDVLRLLKINLLDIDSALPQDALRTSRMNEEKRRAWRAFVKLAKSIYEMVQAAIVLEDVIKSEYLKTNWWYWSSPATAAKITTLSALALRIYVLDSAISYDQPFAAATLEPNSMLDEDEPPSRKTPEADPVEKPRTRTRASKRRKE